MQEWLDLARDDVSRLRLTPPLVSLLVGWLVRLITSAMKTGTARFFKTLASTNKSSQRLNPKNIIRTVTAMKILNLTRLKIYFYFILSVFTSSAFKYALNKTN
jgi:hypothetical protein